MVEFVASPQVVRGKGASLRRNRTQLSSVPLMGEQVIRSVICRVQRICERDRSWKSNGVDERAWQRRGPERTSSRVGWGQQVRRRGRKCRWKGKKRMSVKKRAGADRQLDLLSKSDSRQEEVNGGIVSELEVQVGRVSGGVGHSVEELVKVDGSERRSKRSGKVVTEEREEKIVSALLGQSVEAEGRTRKRSWQVRK